jgi:hypothetical protein
MFFLLSPDDYKRGLHRVELTFCLDLLLHIILGSTGGPCYSRSFYLRFHLFGSKESIPKFGSHGLSLAYLQCLTVFDIKSSFI